MQCSTYGVSDRVAAMLRLKSRNTLCIYTATHIFMPTHRHICAHLRVRARARAHTHTHTHNLQYQIP
jgi:hypothetical protein